MEEIETNFQKHGGLGEDAHVVFFEARDNKDDLALSCCICSASAEKYGPVSITRDSRTGDFRIILQSAQRRKREREAKEASDK